MIKKFSSLVFIAFLSVLISCSSVSNRQVEKKPALPAIIKLKLKPRAIKIIAGYKARFTVIGFDDKNRQVNIAADWKLINSKNTVGTLDNVKSGIVTFTAETPGTATLEACYGGYNASADIEVIQNRGKR